MVLINNSKAFCSQLHHLKVKIYFSSYKVDAAGECAAPRGAGRQPRHGHVETLGIYELGFIQNYYTFASISPLCTAFHRTKFMNYKCFHVKSTLLPTGPCRWGVRYTAPDANKVALVEPLMLS